MRHGGQLREGTPARPLVLALLDVHLDPAAVGPLEVVDEARDLGAVVPDVELVHGGVAAHAPAIGVDGRPDRGLGPRRLEPVLVRRDDEAGRQPGHVPLEGPGERLVEVPQVEVEVALGRRPQAEVEDVSIAAELDLQTAVRARGEVGRHDRRGATVVVPRRAGHALVAQRRKLGQADGVLGQHGLERIVATDALVPGADGRAGRVRTGGPAPGPALGLRGGKVVVRHAVDGHDGPLFHGSHGPT